MVTKAGKARAALDRVVALDLTGGRVPVCVERVLDVENFEIEVIFRVAVEFHVPAAALDPLSVPGEFEEVVDDFGEGIAEDAGDFQKGEETGCAKAYVVVGWEEGQSGGTGGADEGEDGFGEGHAGDSDIRPGGKLALESSTYAAIFLPIDLESDIRWHIGEILAHSDHLTQASQMDF